MINDWGTRFHVIIFRKHYFLRCINLNFSSMELRAQDQIIHFHKRKCQRSFFTTRNWILNWTAKSFHFHSPKGNASSERDDSFSFWWATFEVKKSRKQLDCWQVNLGPYKKKYSLDSRSLLFTKIFKGIICVLFLYLQPWPHVCWPHFEEAKKSPGSTLYVCRRRISEDWAAQHFYLKLEQK